MKRWDPGLLALAAITFLLGLLMLIKAAPANPAQVDGCPAGTSGKAGDVQVLPCLWVPAPEADEVAQYLADELVRLGHAVRIDGELVPWTLDLYEWTRMAGCEASGRWHIDNPPFGGGLQIHYITWRGYGLEFAPTAATASIEEQIEVGRRILDVQGPGAWPTCRQILGW